VESTVQAPPPRPADVPDVNQAGGIAPPLIAAPAPGASRRRGRAPVATIAPFLAAVVALLIATGVPNRELAARRQIYPAALSAFGALMVLAFVVQLILPPVRRWLEIKGPIFAAGILLVALWDVITRKLALLPLPYFPAPDLILQSMADDWRELGFSAYHSLLLLGCGYLTGVAIGLISGVVIGWSSRARYWLMPLLKIVGPIPATAFIPLALIVFKTTFAGGVALIALAVWFPVTMLTSSGVSNVRVSYLDVARTLGAGRMFLIFRVAVPSALPSIFIGLFMGLGAAFLTLFAAEMLGVKAGLGWYINWKRDWAEYSQVYAALVIIAAVFSTVMTLLFKVRDWVLSWQKGVIRW
jgi:NitT/TauT family transport system permease protein